MKNESSLGMDIALHVVMNLFKRCYLHEMKSSIEAIQSAYVVLTLQAYLFFPNLTKQTAFNQARP